MTSANLLANKRGGTDPSIARVPQLRPSQITAILGPTASAHTLVTYAPLADQHPHVPPVSPTLPSGNKPLSAPVRSNESHVPNVLIFGETGTGKSSLINMIAGKDIARVSDDALGCTFGNVCYGTDVDGVNIKLWDTAGLDEGEYGSVPAGKARSNLQNLVMQVTDGVDLLVYCIRGTRYRDILLVNYDIFVRIICQSSVPVVIVVAGLEHQDPMDSWWTENEHEFSRRGMSFIGHACVTTTKGKLLKSGEYMLEEEYAVSEKAVRELIKTHLLAAPRGNIPAISMDAINATLEKYYNTNGQTNVEMISFSQNRPPQNMFMVAIDFILRLMYTVRGGYPDVPVRYEEERNHFEARQFQHAEMPGGLGHREDRGPYSSGQGRPVGGYVDRPVGRRT